MLEIGKKGKLLAGLCLGMGLFHTTAFAEAPNAPGPFIGATKVDDSTVKIDFLDNSDNELGFEIIGDLSLSIPANDETQHPYVYANLTDLECDEVYTIQALAYNEDGNSTLSDPRSFSLKSTFGVDCAAEDGVELPAAPGSYIGVTDINKTAVRISIKDNSNNETGFRIVGNGINMTLPAHDETQHPYVYANITGLTCDEVYEIQAVAFNGMGDSVASDPRAFRISSTFNVVCDDEVAEDNATAE